MLKDESIDLNLNLKRLFIADSDEYDVYDLDIANAEMRILAAYSQDKALITAFEEGKDLHTLTAAGISDFTYEEILDKKEDKDTEEYRVRQVAKAVNFGTIFCQGAESLSEQLWAKMRIRISVEEAQEYLDKFFQTYPGVQDYIRRTKRFAGNHSFTYTFTGRRRRFPLIKYSRFAKSRSERQAVNARIQTTSSDIVLTNMIDLDKAIKPLGGRILLTVHDSIVFQLPKGTTGVQALLDKVVIENVAKKYPWMPVDWKYDCGTGPSYGDCKEDVAA